MRALSLSPSMKDDNHAVSTRLQGGTTLTPEDERIDLVLEMVADIYAVVLELAKLPMVRVELIPSERVKRFLKGD